LLLPEGQTSEAWEPAKKQCTSGNRGVLDWKVRSQWPHGLSRGSAAVCMLELRVRIPPGTWMAVSCECCVLSGRGLCFGLITRPEESYRVWCVCDREASIMRRTWPTRGCRTIGEKWIEK
jgi:hypothetical protein